MKVPQISNISTQPGDRMKNISPLLLVHGGAGFIPEKEKKSKEEGTKQAIKAGSEILINDGKAIDAVQRAVETMEDNPVFNAGNGSVLTRDGRIEMDALIMDGATLNAGGIIGVAKIKNPIKLARAVLDKSNHVLLNGKEAEKFGELHHVTIVDENTLITENAKQRLAKHIDSKRNYYQDEPEHYQSYGTVGAVALDKYGNFAAATSTGGVMGKQFGRVGDTPIIGSGTYADEEIAISATGIGEHIMRYTLASNIKLKLQIAKNAEVATTLALEEMKQKINGTAGVIVITKEKGCAVKHNTRHLAYAKMQ